MKILVNNSTIANNFLSWTIVDKNDSATASGTYSNWSLTISEGDYKIWYTTNEGKYTRGLRVNYSDGTFEVFGETTLKDLEYTGTFSITKPVSSLQFIMAGSGDQGNVWPVQYKYKLWKAQ